MKQVIATHKTTFICLALHYAFTLLMLYNLYTPPEGNVPCGNGTLAFVFMVFFESLIACVVLVFKISMLLIDKKPVAFYIKVAVLLPVTTFLMFCLADWLF